MVRIHKRKWIVELLEEVEGCIDETMSDTTDYWSLCNKSIDIK